MLALDAASVVYERILHACALFGRSPRLCSSYDAQHRSAGGASGRRTHLSFTHPSQHQLGVHLQPSDPPAGIVPASTQAVLIYLSVGVWLSRVSCSRAQALLDNCIGFGCWAWIPSCGYG